MKKIKVKDLRPDDRNCNAHTERGDAMVEKSLRQYGAGRSILIDRDNRIIAGNATAENAGQIGMEDVIVVDSDGTKLVAVRRTDSSLDDPRARELAVLDNRTAEVNLNWDASALMELKTSGVDLSEFFGDSELTEIGVTVPVFGPVSESEQGRLDQKKPFTCPKCNYEFTT